MVKGRPTSSGPAPAPVPIRGGRRPIRPVEVLEDSLRVVDHLVAVDYQRDPPLAGELLDLRPLRAPVWEPLDPVVEPEPPKPAGDRPARAQHVGWSRTAVEDDRGSVAPGRIAARAGPPRALGFVRRRIGHWAPSS